MADGLGLLASTACAVHCLIGPAILVAGTTLSGTLLSGEAFHEAMVLAILPSAVLAFGLGCWRHRDRWVLTVGILGLVGMCLSVSMAHELLGESGETAITLASAALLVTGHVRNFGLCRSSRCEG